MSLIGNSLWGGGRLWGEVPAEGGYGGGAIVGGGAGGVVEVPGGYGEPGPVTPTELLVTMAWDRDPNWASESEPPAWRRRIWPIEEGTCSVGVGGQVVSFAHDADNATVAAAFDTAGFAVTVADGPLPAPICVSFDAYSMDAPLSVSPLARVRVAPCPSGDLDGLYASRRRFYRLEIYGQDGEYLGEIVDFIGGQFTERRNEAGELTFTIPAGDSGDGLDGVGIHVRLLDRWGLVLAYCTVTSTTLRRDPDGSAWTDVVAHTGMAQLSQEAVIAYSCTDRALSEVVEDLIALQAHDFPLGMGVVADSLKDLPVTIDISHETILGALRLAQEQLPRASAGYMYVDALRNFHWRDTVGVEGETITLGERLRSVRRTRDLGELVTRVYVFGEGQDPDSRLTLLDAGEGQQYKERNTGTYGVHSLIVRDSKLTDAAALVRLADRILDDHSTPKITHELEAIDLAKADGFAGRTGGGWDAGWMDFFIGGNYTVVDAGLGINDAVEVVEVSYDLSSPLPVRLTLSNAQTTLSDSIASILDQLNPPLKVDGDRYPTMGRNYSERNATAARAGDVRHTATPQMHNGASWTDLAADADVPTPSDGTPYNVSNSAGSAGTSIAYARADHVHYYEDSEGGVMNLGTRTSAPTTSDVPAGSAAVYFLTNDDFPQLWSCFNYSGTLYGERMHYATETATPFEEPS